MNRHERRKAKKCRTGDVISTSYGHLLEQDPNYGLTVECYLCATPHKAHGLARIEHNRSIIAHVPLCEQCAGPRSGDAVFRKFYNAPDMKVTEGGMISTEQIEAMIDKQDAAQH